MTTTTTHIHVIWRYYNMGQSAWATEIASYGCYWYRTPTQLRDVCDGVSKIIGTNCLSVTHSLTLQFARLPGYQSTRSSEFGRDSSPRSGFYTSQDTWNG